MRDPIRRCVHLVIVIVLVVDNKLMAVSLTVLSAVLSAIIPIAIIIIIVSVITITATGVDRSRCSRLCLFGNVQVFRY